MTSTATKARASTFHPSTFHLYLVKPSHYDDDGYVIQWLQSEIPSNTLASLNGIALDLIDRNALGEGVELKLHSIDESNKRIRPGRIARTIQRSGGHGMVALVGVQSNQFPRALDLARALIQRGIPVCIGGFHVSGSQAMLPGVQPEIQEALDLGVSIFTGEAEGRFDEVLLDAFHGRMKPYYDHVSDLPGLEGVPIPFLPLTRIKRTRKMRTSFDSGRGCPFQCSFCTIINVQGHKSRYRTADDIEKILRENLAQGVRHFFITDDNFARNRNWEAIFDRIISIKEETGANIKLIIQVDTLCHKIRNFVKKAGLAGVNRVFVGLENINPDNLMAAQKRQNRITEYRALLQAWKEIRAIVVCGYIIGFPADTRETVLRDIEIVKRELPIDILEFFCLTPLPGSKDHQVLYEAGAWLEPDLNKYDLEHVCADHPLMSREEFLDTYRLAWESFYSEQHIETLLRRTVALGMNARRITMNASWFYGCFAYEKIHPLQGGYLRRKYRKDRRPDVPIESFLTFHLRYIGETVGKIVQFARLYRKFRRIQTKVENDPRKMNYVDTAIKPVDREELRELELFTVDPSAQLAAEKVLKRAARQ